METTNRRSTYYTLDENNQLVRAKDSIEWALWMARHQDRIQIGDWNRDGVRVSTVFTGEWRPFETMIWGGKHDQRKWFYMNYGSALTGHVDIIRRYFTGWGPTAS